MDYAFGVLSVLSPKKQKKTADFQDGFPAFWGFDLIPGIGGFDLIPHLED
jgi:hypothetical protein